jgi:DNA-binding Lrp family transcriptional regulator
MYRTNRTIAMKELEEIDIKILKILLKDGRTNFTNVARQCNVSKDVIWTHYKDLKKAGIIVGATIQFNFQKFGYNGFAMIMLNVESQDLSDVFGRVSTIPDVYAFRYYNSNYNIAAISTLKNLSDLERVKQIINKENKINEFKTQLWIDVRNIPENILEDHENQNEYVNPQINTKINPAKIDEIDLQIINALTINGRLAFRKIAQQIGTTTATVARRYEKLKENNFIKVSIQINFLEMGYQNILEISLALADQNEANEMANKLSKIPGVTYLVKISGNYDMSVVALVKDCKNIVEISDQIIKIPNIKKMEATLRRLPAIWPGPRQFISTF